MTELKIIFSENLSFTVNCKNDEANKVLTKILKNFNKGEDITVRYWSEEEITFDYSCIKDIYFNQVNPFYGKLKSIRIYDKKLTDKEWENITKQ